MVNALGQRMTAGQLVFAVVLVLGFIAGFTGLTKIAEGDPRILVPMTRVLNEILNIEQEVNENRKA